eukprot:scaffold197883_cov39-Tisochrysis_lutea.AAC.1
MVLVVIGPQYPFDVQSLDTSQCRPHRDVGIISLRPQRTSALDETRPAALSAGAVSLTDPLSINVDVLDACSLLAQKCPRRCSVKSGKDSF